MDLTRVTGIERKDNLHIFLVATYTIQGKAILKPFLNRARILLTAIQFTITLLLSVERRAKSRNIPRVRLLNMPTVIDELSKSILQYLPKEVVHPTKAPEKTMVPERSRGGKTKKIWKVEWMAHPQVSWSHHLSREYGEVRFSNWFWQWSQLARTTTKSLSRTRSLTQVMSENDLQKKLQLGVKRED